MESGYTFGVDNTEGGHVGNSRVVIQKQHGKWYYFFGIV